jgi:hypothetical protein
MLLKETSVYHERMTAPAKEGDIGSEPDISRPVPCRVRLDGMAEEANRFAVHVQDGAISCQHKMRIDLCILVFRMTFKAELSPVGIGTSP